MIIIISTHTPVRVWQNQTSLFEIWWKISTHTPVRVWLSIICGSNPTSIFQLTHPWGCDVVTASDASAAEKFQLTHPWGCDLITKGSRYSEVISTHTPVRVWHLTQFTIIFINEFQLTHPWGCDSSPSPYSLYQGNFNSHTREGVTFMAVET